MLQNHFLHPAYFVTGIDTDCGKTVCTATLSSQLQSEGCRVITQKLIQTGCEGLSEDIITHRRIEGRPLTARDLDGTTCPLVYSYPCSPHMATQLDQREVDLSLATRATQTLLVEWDKVLIEGAGGVMVPLTDSYLTLDYIADQQLPTIVVTTAKLGSINHTLLTLSALASRGIEISALLYNTGLSTDPLITAETERYLRSYLSTHYPSTYFHSIHPLSHV